jgi:Zn-dependent peptidase ImmA (M78 family)
MARSSGAVALPQRPANLAPGDKDRVVPLVDSIAAQWSVSQPMVAYRLHRLGWITPSLYSDLCSSYAARWHATKQREKEKNKEKEGGPTYYTMRQYSLGDALIDVVRRTLRGNALTDTKAAKMLGIKPGLVETLLRTVEKGRGPFPHDHGG